MGFHIHPDDYESGNACGFCWGVGKHFGDTPTPKYIYAYYYGIRKGVNWIPALGGPPNGWYKMEQQVDNCHWQVTVGVWVSRLKYFAGNTDLKLIQGGAPMGFFSVTDPTCSTLLTSELFEPPARFFTEGSCIIWPSQIGQELLFTMGLSSQLNTRMTMRGVANGDYVLRFTNPDGSMNFKVKVSTDIL